MMTETALNHNMKNDVVRPDGKARMAWCLYDWAHSAFSTIIITFVFSVYFAKGVFGDETVGGGWWSLAMSCSGLLVAIASPFLGAVSDHSRRRVPWIMAFTIIGCLATCSLFFGPPAASFSMIILVLVLAGLANAAFEFAWVFNNSLLLDLSERGHMGSLSGKAWAVGYAGGLVSLTMTLILFVGMGSIAPLIPLPQDDAIHIRATVFFVALWIAVFSIPLFLWVKEGKPDTTPLLRRFAKGWGGLKDGVKVVWKDKNLLTYLLASALYRDGLVTLFTVGGVFAAAAFELSFQEILLFAIGLNVTAGVGAFGMAKLDDKIGSKKVITISLIGLIVTGTVILFLQDATSFIATSLVLGLFVGPVQAASRTMTATLAPPDKAAQIFGFYTLTGKSLAFFGPLAYGALTLAFDSARVGLASIIAFWVVGLLLLMVVRDDKH